MNMTAKTQPLKKPPQNIEAEKHVLGCALINPEHTNLVLDSLEEKDFFSESHRLIFVAMQQLKEQSKSIDSVTVVGQLMESKKLDSVRVDGMGGMEYIPYLSDNIPLSVNIDAWVQSILEKSQLRKLQTIGKGMMDRIGEDTNFADAFQYVEHQVEKIRKKTAALTAENRRRKLLQSADYRNFRNNRNLFYFAGTEVDQTDIVSPRPASTKFPSTIFDRWFGAMAEISQAPFAMCGNAALSAMTFAVQHLANVNVPGTRFIKPLTNFYVTIAQSGERKSTVNGLAMNGVEMAEAELEKECVELEKEHARKLFYYERNKQRVKGDKSADYDEMGEEPPPPKKATLVLKDPTADGIFCSLQTGQYSQGLWTEEGGTLVGGFAMSKDQRRRTTGIFNQLWDGKSLDRPRVGSNEKIRGRRFAMHIFIQPKTSIDLVEDELMKDQGLLARMLMSEPDTLVSKRPYTRPSEESFDVCAAFDDHIKKLVLLTPRYNSMGDGLDPRTVYVCDQAEPLWIDFYNEVELKLADEYKSIIGFASKAAEHVLRISAVIELFQDPGALEITTKSLQSGIALVRYYLAEQLRIQHSRPTEEEENAQVLIDWLNENWEEEFVSIPCIGKFGPNSIRKSKVAKLAVELAVEHGHLQVWPNKETIRGFPRKTVFRVIPKSCGSCGSEEEQEDKPC